MNSINARISGMHPLAETGEELPLAGGSIRAGFPSPAHDFAAERLDLMKLLVKHPQATYFWRVAGDSMHDAGIDDGDLITVDRALRPRHNSIVVALVDGDCTVKYLHEQAGQMKLRAANPNYPDILPRDGQTIEVWGVVTACIKRFSPGP
jgi:DNA polymerase V